MRIAVIYLGRRGSGGPISIELAKNLAGQAQVFGVVSAQAEHLPLWKACGLELVRVPTFENPAGAAWSWLDRRPIRHLANEIRARQPDVLLFPMAHPWNFLLQQALRPIPSVVIVHDPLPHPGLTAAFYAWFEDRAIRQAAYCVVLSCALAPALQRRGAPPDRIAVAEHGLLAYDPPADEIAESPSQAAPALLFFGRIAPYKGLEVLLKAYRELSRQYPRLHLWVVGDGDLRPYRNLLDGLPRVEVVNRWVAEAEVAGYFRRASLVALPYTGASQSGVLAIAANFALPVVATRVGGIPEQIKDGETGLLVPPGSVDELSGAVRRLLDDPEEARRLGLNLRKDFLQNKSWSATAQKIYAVCCRVAAEGSVDEG